MVTEWVRAARSAVEFGCSGGIYLGPDGSWDLSDEERRRLEEIERSLQSEGEGFRAGLGRRVVILFARAGEVDDARQRRRVAACAVMGVGLVVLLTGLMLTQGSTTVGVMVAVVGSVIMSGAAVLFLRHGPAQLSGRYRRPCAVPAGGLLSPVDMSWSGRRLSVAYGEPMRTG